MMNNTLFLTYQIVPFLNGKDYALFLRTNKTILKNCNQKQQWRKLLPKFVPPRCVYPKLNVLYAYKIKRYGVYNILEEVLSRREMDIAIRYLRNLVPRELYKKLIRKALCEGKISFCKSRLRLEFYRTRHNQRIARG